MKFNIKLTIEIDEEERILPIVAEMHEEAVAELFQDIIYDIELDLYFLLLEENPSIAILRNMSD